VQVHESYQLLQTGTWWTSWCHDPNDVSPGGFAGITEAATTTVTFDGDLTLAGPLTEIIDAHVGFSVEESKSFGREYGCNNPTSTPQALWWQEKMGFANTKVTTVIQDW
jgi:hypothetical protein